MADEQVAAILRALAELAPGDRVAEDVADVATDDARFAWLGLTTDPTSLFSDQAEAPLPVVPRSPVVKRLRGLEALRYDEQPLRLGWLFLCGRAEVNGRPKRVCMPLVSRPVASSSQPVVGIVLHGRGEATVLGRFADPAPLPDAAWGSHPSKRLLAHDPVLRSWIDGVVRASGFPPVADVLGPDASPAAARRRADLVVVVGCALYLAPEEPLTTRRSTLRAWAGVDGTAHTAMAAAYGLWPSTPIPPTEDDRPDVLSPLPLTEAQAEVVERARHEPITVVSGAPGNGKSHTVCAVAIDAVTSGRSVLVVTPTPFAADALGELLARQPGPQPVYFGEAEGRRQMLAVLESISRRTVDREELDRLRGIAEDAEEVRVAAEAAVVSALVREVRAARAARWTPRLTELRGSAPRAFDADADLADLQRLLDRSGSWPRSWRRRALRRAVGAGRGVPVELLAEALSAAGDIRAELDLKVSGGTTIGEAWDFLLAAERTEAESEGQLAAGLALDARRWTDRGRRAVAALSSALSASRASRRDLLARIDAPGLVRALPLWVGTLRDVDDLLPARPGLFDLVVVDEAAQVDQFRAAGALLRGRRAVVVGDPHQLRHVSFVADSEVAEVVEASGAGAVADRLDVRRQALYDVAAGAAPVTFLDEHHRSAPHLIEFSARRFYDGRIRLATRNLVNESQDAIGIVRVATVADEVGAAVDRVLELVGHGLRDIGVFTPFRAHADALEAELLRRFAPEELLAHGIRSGTAHSSQGSERDHVVVALGLAADDPPGRWRFAENPNLFNVLVTRARRQLTVVTALAADHARPGIVADYLHHATVPPEPQPGGPPRSAWVAELAAELGRNGVAVRTSYPVGRWEVDIVAGEGDGAVALDCEVHPDGPEAHLDRHRALRRAGWRSLDAFASRWDGDAARAAVELSGVVRGQG